MERETQGREPPAIVEREELIKAARDRIRGALGTEKYQDTLNNYEFWAKLGDPVYGAAVWFMLENQGLPPAQAEELFQVYQSGRFQRKISERLGLPLDWRGLAPENRPRVSTRTTSELLEAVVGRLCFEDPRHKVPVWAVEQVFALLEEEEKDVKRPTRQGKFEMRYPGYKVLKERKGKEGWTVKILDPSGEVLVEAEARGPGQARKLALKQAKEKLAPEE